jgi:hypothetical protein
MRIMKFFKRFKREYLEISSVRTTTTETHHPSGARIVPAPVTRASYATKQSAAASRSSVTRRRMNVA